MRRPLLITTGLVVVLLHGALQLADWVDWHTRRRTL